MKSKTYLAIDIGASFRRHIVAWEDAGILQTREIYRFPNSVAEQEGHLVRDIDALEQHVINEIQVAKEAFSHIDSLSINT